MGAISLQGGDADPVRVAGSSRRRFASAVPLDAGKVGPRPLYEVTKRTLDVALSLVSLCLLSPLLLLIAGLIKLEDGGPVLFWQWRMGFGARRFRFYKFRSMCVDAERQLGVLRAQEEIHSPRFKMKRDPRVTRTGRLLRRFSLDEVPRSGTSSWAIYRSWARARRSPKRWPSTSPITAGAWRSFRA